ncbi:RSP_7527 family protein [Natronohydrobacter thiooxidans]|uniref:RSP_7527 family protein n=1 Tax=Natronohydrobacter thiooxidans TaxID=87172 RepID=UPI000B1C3B78|nr:hypothetical protein [Natronohydrobacter thiooxidans]
MFDPKTTRPVILDALQIEAEARRLRAEFIAAAFASLKAKIVAALQHATAGKATA